MSEYKGIKGFQVQTRTEDPTPYAQALADNPYGGVWSSGGNLNTARRSYAGWSRNFYIFYNCRGLNNKCISKLHKQKIMNGSSLDRSK